MPSIFKSKKSTEATSKAGKHKPVEAVSLLHFKQQREHRKANKQRTAEEQQNELTHYEIASRVKEIRGAFSEARERLAAGAFEAITAGSPRSIYSSEEKEVVDWARYLNPRLELYSARLDKMITGHEAEDLGVLQWEGAETAFQLGVLFGAMQVCPDEKQIDRYANALVRATAARNTKQG